jgi:hypothetical protein
LEKDNTYTMVAAGTEGGRRLIYLVDDFVAPATGRAALRFVHASADSPGIDATAGYSTVVATGVEFGSAGDYVDVAGGFTNLAVTNSSSGSELVGLDDVWLKPLAVYSAFLIGEMDAGALTVVVIRDADFGVATPTPPPAREWRLMLPIGYR